MQYIVPVHNNRRCYKLMREPCNIKDSNAVAIVDIVRGKSGDKDTKEADDVHSNNVTDRFEVICPVPALMATWLSKFLKSLRKSNNQGETIGFVWVLENLESILEFYFGLFPGMESPGKRPLLLESSGNLLNSAKKYEVYRRQLQ